ncbi:MAG: sigma-70 family RNA polymerase sigma factor [Myxococcota bacterium]
MTTDQCIHEEFPADIKGLHQRLRRYALRHLPHHDAEDAVQETWIAYYRGQFEGRARIDTYLFSILRRRIIDRYRRRRATPLRDTHTPVETRFEERVDARDTLAEIERLGRTLTDAQQVALRGLLQGTSRSDLARELGMTRATLRVLIHRTRLALSNALPTEAA